METITLLIRKVNEELNLFVAGYGRTTFSIAEHLNAIEKYIYSEETFQYLTPLNLLFTKIKTLTTSSEIVCRNVRYLSKEPAWMQQEIERLSEEYSDLDEYPGVTFDWIEYEITDEERVQLNATLKEELKHLQIQIELLLTGIVNSKGLIKHFSEKPNKLTRTALGFLIQMLIRTGYINADDKKVLAEKFATIFSFSPQQLAEDIGSQILTNNPSTAKIAIQRLEVFFNDLLDDLNTQKVNLK